MTTWLIYSKAGCLFPSGLITFSNSSIPTSGLSPQFANSAIWSWMTRLTGRKTLLCTNFLNTRIKMETSTATEIFLKKSRFSSSQDMKPPPTRCPGPYKYSDNCKTCRHHWDQNSNNTSEETCLRNPSRSKRCRMRSWPKRWRWSRPWPRCSGRPTRKGHPWIWTGAPWPSRIHACSWRPKGRRNKMSTWIPITWRKSPRISTRSQQTSACPPRGTNRCRLGQANASASGSNWRCSGEALSSSNYWLNTE